MNARCAAPTKVPAYRNDFKNEEGGALPENRNLFTKYHEWIVYALKDGNLFSDLAGEAFGLVWREGWRMRWNTDRIANAPQARPL